MNFISFMSFVVFIYKSDCFCVNWTKRRDSYNFIRKNYFMATLKFFHRVAMWRQFFCNLYILRQICVARPSLRISYDYVAVRHPVLRHDKGDFQIKLPYLQLIYCALFHATTPIAAFMSHFRYLNEKQLPFENAECYCLV